MSEESERMIELQREVDANYESIRRYAERRGGASAGPGVSVECLSCGRRFRAVGDLLARDMVWCPYCGQQQ